MKSAATAPAPKPRRPPTTPSPPDLNELRITGPISEVEVVGEERQDVESTVHVESNGYDEAEAREYVKQSKLVVDRAASALILRMEFPRGGRQRGILKLKVPSRLQVRVEPGSGGAEGQQRGRPGD